MSVHFLADGALVDAPACALAIGNFDGVHRGHSAMFESLVRNAKARGIVPAALTFDPHPALAFGRSAPPMLSSLDRKIELGHALGLERIYVQRFDEGFARTTAEAFGAKLIAKRLQARFVLVGRNFRFGQGRAGDIDTLVNLGAAHGFATDVFDMVVEDGAPISSSRIRDAVREGDVTLAKRLLGRPHSLTGAVIHGKKLGRTIGFPTANLSGVVEALPAFGVYAVLVERVDQTVLPVSLGPGVMNVGLRPTVEGAAIKPRCEVHLFEGGDDIYGATLRVHLVHRVREERKFDSVEFLKLQIARDVEVARVALAGYI